MTTRWRVVMVGLLGLFVAGPAAAQVVTTTRTITASGADCSVAVRCAEITSAPRANGTVLIEGTFTGTMQFEGTLEAGDGATWFALPVTPVTGGTAVASATAAGTWTVGTAVARFRVRASALSSGTPKVTMLFSIYARGGGGAGGGGSGGVTDVFGTANEITSTGGTAPTLSLPSALTFTGKTVTGGTFTGSTITSPSLTNFLSVTAIAAPSTPAAGLGRVYVDSTTKTLCVKDDAGTVTCTGGGGGGTPGGATTQIQFNNAGAFGGSADLRYNATSVAFPTERGVIMLEKTLTDFSHDYEIGDETILFVAPAANTTATVFGKSAYVEVPAGNTADIGEIVGLYGAVNHSGSGTVGAISGAGFNLTVAGPTTSAYGNYVFADTAHATGAVSELYGVYARARNDNAGNVTTLYGMAAAAANIGTGTVTSMYGLHVAAPINSGGGAITTNYGLRIDDQAVTGGTSDYALWYNGVGTGAGVWRVNHLGVLAYYNPSFAAYTPDAVNHERIVTQWNTNVAEIGTEAGGTGTLRAVKILGSALTVPPITSTGAMTVAAASALGWTGRSAISSGSDGEIRLSPNNTTALLATLDLGGANGAPRFSVGSGTLSLDTRIAGSFTTFTVVGTVAAKKIAPTAFVFANIATVLTANGDSGYCSDCTIANPCAGSGTGAYAKRLNGVQVCN